MNIDRINVQLMKEKVQINVRIDANLRRSHKLVTDVADESLEAMTEAALRFFYGSKDSGVIELRRKALAAVSTLEKGSPLPFNSWPESLISAA